jgi:hypothetical protein
MELRFGGNDVGSVMIEENVVRSARVTNCTTEEELRRMIRDAGFRPAPRHGLPYLLSELTSEPDQVERSMPERTSVCESDSVSDHSSLAN